MKINGVCKSYLLHNHLFIYPAETVPGIIQELGIERARQRKVPALIVHPVW